jgi:hypothetical protein
MDAWNANWLQLKTRGTDTSELSTDLVLGAFRGDNAFRQLEILEQADDDEQLGGMIFSALRLCCELARRNRTPHGLLEIGAALQDIEETAPERTSAAARLLLGYQIADDVAHFDSIDSLDPGVFWALGADGYNATLTEAGIAAYSVVVEALALWRTMLPEVSESTINTVAAQLWESE